MATAGHSSSGRAATATWPRPRVRRPRAVERPPTGRGPRRCRGDEPDQPGVGTELAGVAEDGEHGHPGEDRSGPLRPTARVIRPTKTKAKTALTAAPATPTSRRGRRRRRSGRRTRGRSLPGRSPAGDRERLVLRGQFHDRRDGLRLRAASGAAAQEGAETTPPAAGVEHGAPRRWRRSSRSARVRPLEVVPPGGGSRPAINRTPSTRWATASASACSRSGRVTTTAARESGPAAAGGRRRTRPAGRARRCRRRRSRRNRPAAPASTRRLPLRQGGLPRACGRRPAAGAAGW